MKKIRNFDIQTKLGSGSYGVIYKAINKITKEICVLKQISLGRLGQKARKSAINEATIMGKLVHPFIVRYRQSFIEDNTLNIVMEYCNNGDLNNFLKLQNKRPMKEQKIWRFFIEICIGLEYIHKNKILHRDIKTLNIFMNKDQEIKIGDLGVAKMLTSNQFAQTMVGTPFYLSPQLCQEKPYNEKSDIWAMGCLLYELCTFRHPFEAHNQASLILKIVRGKYLPIPEFYSKDLKEIIDVCLERDYKRRPTTSNLLARPKIRDKVQEFGINKLVEDEMRKIIKEKEIIGTIPKAAKEEKQILPNKQKVVKAVDSEVKKIIKTVESEQKIDIFKKQEPKKQLIKREEHPKKQQTPKVKRQPVIILPKPINYSQRKIQPVHVSAKKDQETPKQNKNDFVSNLHKMMDEDEKQKKFQKPGNVYSDSPVKVKDIKRQERVQRITEKVEELKGKNLELLKSPSMNEAKRDTSSIPNKKVSVSNDVRSVKKVEVAKPPVLPSKPPLAPSSQKQPIMKVKHEKVIQPKVYESHKNLNKPSGIIKSGGFTSNVEQEKEKGENIEAKSRQKLFSAKRVSNPNIIRVKQQKEPPKQLFGPSPTPLLSPTPLPSPSPSPTPSVQHKSQKQIKAPGYSALYDEKKRQQNNKISRVRKGSKNEMARNARNVSRHNEVSKQEQDLVMNLPTSVKNNGEISSQSDDEVRTGRETHVIDDLKRKSNPKGFHLKDINHELVLQKYQDMMSNEQDETLRVEESEIYFNENQDYEQKVPERKMVKQVKAMDADVNNDEDDQMNEENIAEDLQYIRRNSYNSSEPIEQLLQNEMVQDRIQPQEQQEIQFTQQEQIDGDLYEEKNQDEWSFDQEPELPLLQEKESPDFEAHNPYLIEQQEQSMENKINYLQTKLSQNMKREDEINKLMQIKLEECRKFIGNQKSLQQILQFFRKKLHMEQDYSESDEKDVQLFLKRKGLTDHYKFQNIYKIMHFEMQLQNTRKIIQRICKKLSQLEEAP